MPTMPQSQMCSENLIRPINVINQESKKFEALPILQMQCQMLDGNEEIIKSCCYAHTGIPICPVINPINIFLRIY